LTIIFSSRVLNQPLAPRNQEAVEVGDEGIKRKAKRPTTRVMRPWKISQNVEVTGWHGVLLRSEIAIANRLDLLLLAGEGVHRQETRLGHQPSQKLSRKSRGVEKAHDACKSTISTKLPGRGQSLDVFGLLRMLTSGMNPP
jgi:hypothetical protein